MQTLRLRLLRNTGSLSWGQASTNSMHPFIAYVCTSRVRDGYQLGGPMAAKETRSGQAIDRVSETCVRF